MMNDEHDSDFAEYLLDKHYSATTVGSYCRMLKNLKIDDSLIEPTQIYENINRCLDDYSSYAGSRAVAIAKVVVNRYFEMKTGRHVSEFINSNDRHEIAILNEFYQYSVNFKKMTVAASKAECQHIRFLLNSLDENRLNNLSSITAADIRKYITDHFQRLKPSSIGRYISSLRNFFRFLEFNGIKVDTAIFLLPMTSANWKNQNIPITLDYEEEMNLRNHIFPDNELGIRNRVILLLLLDLGLRCSEIPAIQLQDIHWSTGTIVIRNSKNKGYRELPMSKELGQTIESYILKYREKYHSEALILNTKPCLNHSPITVGSVRSVIRHLYKICSVSGWWKGTHAIRRTAASHIYNSGAGIKLTADILGHDSVDSSTHYVKVDIESLRSLCREWPEKEAAE
jgi:site-specific recombinase XerD